MKMKNIILACLLVVTTGCATAIVRPYVGEQQAWPTGQGSIANTKYDMPVFTSLPPVSYDLIGELRIESPFYLQPEEHHLGVLIKKALDYKADALVLVDGQVYFSISYGSRTEEQTHMETAGHAVSLAQVNRFNPLTFTPGVSVLAIRWLKNPPPGLPDKYKHLNHAKTMKKDAPKTVHKPASKPATPSAVEKKPAPAKPATPSTVKPPAKPSELNTNVIPARPASSKPADDAR
jgi:hypothetical protein